MEITDTMENVTNTLLKLYCIDLTGSADKFRYLSTSSLNDIAVKRHTKPDVKYKFWAGLSGCNWNVIDHTGGNHDVSYFKKEIVTVVVPEEWQKHMELIKNGKLWWE